MDDTKLIPELKEWRKANDDSFSLEEWIACEGSGSLAVGFLTVFWPSFITLDDCVFLKSNFSIDLYNKNCASQSTDNFGQIEDLMNYFCITDIYSLEQEENLTREQVLFIGYKLREMFDAKLKSEFPQREFVVWFNGEQNFDDLSYYQLSFHQPMNFDRKLSKSLP